MYEDRACAVGSRRIREDAPCVVLPEVERQGRREQSPDTDPARCGGERRDQGEEVAIALQDIEFEAAQRVKSIVAGITRGRPMYGSA